MSAGEKPTLAQQEWVCRARAQMEREDPNGGRADVYEAAADTVSRHATVLSQLSALSAREKVLQQRIEQLEPAAECWNALCASYRITCMGSAGLIEPMKETGYAHATFNLWTAKKAPADCKGDKDDIHGRQRLCDYMLIALNNYRAALSPGEAK